MQKEGHSWLAVAIAEQFLNDLKHFTPSLCPDHVLPAQAAVVESVEDNRDHIRELRNRRDHFGIIVYDNHSAPQLLERFDDVLLLPAEDHQIKRNLVIPLVSFGRPLHPFGRRAGGQDHDRNAKLGDLLQRVGRASDHRQMAVKARFPEDALDQHPQSALVDVAEIVEGVIRYRQGALEPARQEVDVHGTGIGNRPIVVDHKTETGLSNLAEKFVRQEIRQQTGIRGQKNPATLAQFSLLISRIFICLMITRKNGDG